MPAPPSSQTSQPPLSFSSNLTWLGIAAEASDAAEAADGGVASTGKILKDLTGRLT